jgi:hypothetical protein
LVINNSGRKLEVFIPALEEQLEGVPILSHNYYIRIDKFAMFEKEIIKGMIYLPEFITQNEEKELVLYLMEKEWNTSLKRRTQHYGYTYSYDKNNTLEAAQPIPGIFGATKKFIEVYIKDNLEE